MSNVEIEPVAWLHTMHTEDKDNPQIIYTSTNKNPFGIAGSDYSITYLVTSEPIFTAQALQEQAAEIEAHQGKQSSLFAAIKHGDAEHQQWLMQAIEDHFNGRPVAPAVGKGSKDAEIERLQALVDERGWRMGVLHKWIQDAPHDIRDDFENDHPEASEWFDPETGEAK